MENYQEKRLVNILLNEIKVYTKNNCPQCRMQKKLLSDKGIKFTEINIEETGNHVQTLLNYGFRSVPVTAVGSLDNAWSGFRPDRIKELVDQAIKDRYGSQ